MWALLAAAVVAGEAHGTVVLTSAGTSSCVLSGVPALALLAGGHPLAVTDVAPQNPQIAPVVLAPGGAGTLTLFGRTSAAPHRALSTLTVTDAYGRF